MPDPLTLVVQDGVDVPPLPEPHECADCFNAVYVMIIGTNKGKLLELNFTSYETLEEKTRFEV